MSFKRKHEILRVRIAIFFSILFIGLLITPALILITNPSQDISFLIDMNEEEEEKKGKEESKVDSKLKIYPPNFISSVLFNGFENKKYIRFNSKNYISKYPKVSTPPPERIV